MSHRSFFPSHHSGSRPHSRERSAPPFPTWTPLSFEDQDAHFKEMQDRFNQRTADFNRRAKSGFDEWFDNPDRDFPQSRFKMPKEDERSSYVRNIPIFQSNDDGSNNNSENLMREGGSGSSRSGGGIPRPVPPSNFTPSSTGRPHSPEAMSISSGSSAASGRSSGAGNRAESFAQARGPSRVEVSGSAEAGRNRAETFATAKSSVAGNPMENQRPRAESFSNASRSSSAIPMPPPQSSQSSSRPASSAAIPMPAPPAPSRSGKTSPIPMPAPPSVNVREQRGGTPAKEGFSGMGKDGRKTEKVIPVKVENAGGSETKSASPSRTTPIPMGFLPKSRDPNEPIPLGFDRPASAPVDAQEQQQQVPKSKDKSPLCAAEPAPRPESAPPTKTPSPAKAKPVVDPMEQISSIVEKVNDLRDRVENFSGSERDHEYKLLDELLTQHMIKLDGVEPGGASDVRQARRSAIKQIEDMAGTLERRGKKKQSGGESKEATTAPPQPTRIVIPIGPEAEKDKK